MSTITVNVSMTRASDTLNVQLSPDVVQIPRSPTNPIVIQWVAAAGKITSFQWNNIPAGAFRPFVDTSALPAATLSSAAYENATDAIPEDHAQWFYTIGLQDDSGQDTARIDPEVDNNPPS